MKGCNFFFLLYKIDIVRLIIVFTSICRQPVIQLWLDATPHVSYWLIRSYGHLITSILLSGYRKFQYWQFTWDNNCRHLHEFWLVCKTKPLLPTMVLTIEVMSSARFQCRSSGYKELRYIVYNFLNVLYMDNKLKEHIIAHPYRHAATGLCHNHYSPGFCVFSPVLSCRKLTLRPKIPPALAGPASPPPPPLPLPWPVPFP